jgi:molybdopterin/thiamine biosynthesis adenylyltransferase
MTGDRHSRQSFLGATAESTIATAKIGIAGLGGGGSHIVQQLAHVGFRNFVLYDGDVIEASNLNRLVGGTEIDVAMKLPKVLVAERVIRGLETHAHIERYQMPWQDEPKPLRACDIVFGGVDGYRQRWELQVFSRRFCVPYIDVGLDVVTVGDEGPKMRGQVILTVPGGPCMKCIDFITDEGLEEEGALYGDAGVRPQVVWANGVLASTAVGLAVDLLTGWTRAAPPHAVVYLSYDGNTGSLVPDKRLRYLGSEGCRHFADSDVGEPALSKLDSPCRPSGEFAS